MRLALAKSVTIPTMVGHGYLGGLTGRKRRSWPAHGRSRSRDRRYVSTTVPLIGCRRPSRYSSLLRSVATLGGGDGRCSPSSISPRRLSARRTSIDEHPAWHQTITPRSPSLTARLKG